MTNNHPNRSLKTRLRRKVGSGSLIEEWYQSYTLGDDVPLRVTLDDFLDVYEKTYGNRPAYSINDLCQWRRGKRKIPAKAADLMRAELIDFKFGNDLGASFVKKLCLNLNLPVPGDINAQ